MKRIKYVLVLVLILILIVIGIILKKIIHKSESSINQDIISQKYSVKSIQDSLALKENQRKLDEQVSIKPIESTKSIPNFNVSQLTMSEWNTPFGIPYVQVPGANLGATSFEVLDKKRVAYLCDATSEIIITEMKSGKVIKKFTTVLAPRDFIYENGFYFVLGERQVIVYDANGNEKNQFNIPIDYFGRAGRLKRFDNSTYLLFVSGNCVKIESGGVTITPQEYEGWVTSSGSYISTQVKGDNTYSIKVVQANGKILNKVFVTNKKTAGVFVVGTTTNRIVLDVQTFISENPIAIERFIVSVNLQKDDLGKTINSIKIPDSYYVLSNKEFYVSKSGDIMNMVTSQHGVYVFSLTETTSDNGKGYPESLTSLKYHFNDQLIETERK